MKLQIIFATGNQNKIHEIEEIIRDPSIGVMSMKEAGIHSDPDETGTTFEENALIKVRACAKILADHPQLIPDPDVPTVVMSDDSGLVIDALDGMPGIYSARFMGRGTSYTDKNNAILAKMEGVPEEKRTARFSCACAMIYPVNLDNNFSSVKEEVILKHMEGHIAHRIAGSNGFGYDPIFFLPQYGQTSAEIPPEDKNAISHRGKALRAMILRLREIYANV